MDMLVFSCFLLHEDHTNQNIGTNKKDYEQSRDDTKKVHILNVFE